MEILHKTILSKEWWAKALIRALKTFGQAATATIGTTAVMIQEVNWIAVLSVAGGSAIISILTSLAGLPEIQE